MKLSLAHGLSATLLSLAPSVTRAAPLEKATTSVLESRGFDFLSKHKETLNSMKQNKVMYVTNQRKPFAWEHGEERFLLHAEGVRPSDAKTLHDGEVEEKKQWTEGQVVSLEEAKQLAYTGYNREYRYLTMEMGEGGSGSFPKSKNLALSFKPVIPTKPKYSPADLVSLMWPQLMEQSTPEGEERLTIQDGLGWVEFEEEKREDEQTDLSEELQSILKELGNSYGKIFGEADFSQRHVVERSNEKAWKAVTEEVEFAKELVKLENSSMGGKTLQKIVLMMAEQQVTVRKVVGHYAQEENVYHGESPEGGKKEDSKAGTEENLKVGTVRAAWRKLKGSI